MGRDKALIEFEGEPLARRVVTRLASACREVIVASGDGRRLDWLGLPQVADARPDSGPLGGLVAGLEQARDELVAVVAVDMPFASPAVLCLLAGLREREDAAVPIVGGWAQPLHAVYARASAPRLRASLESGCLAMHRALEELDVLRVERSEWSRADPSGGFATNLNEPGDMPDGA